MIALLLHGMVTSALIGLPAVPDRQAPDHLLKFGATPERNPVNLRVTNLPTDWCTEPGMLKNIKWSVDVGGRAYGSPVIANGRVFVATSNGKPRDLNQKKNMPVLMAFAEKDGTFLWQIAHTTREMPIYCPGSPHLLMSTPTVDGRKLYYATPLCEVICADCFDGSIHWRRDLGSEFKFEPYYRCAAAPLIVGDLVFLATGHGVSEAEDRPPAKDVPSFVALNKHTDKLVWQSALPGAGILAGQWSNPTFAVVDGTPQVIFGGGDGVLYSFVPETGKLLWKCDCLPHRKPRRDFPEDNAIVGTPVVVGNRLYIGLGVENCGTRNPPRFSYFLCLDIRKRGDVSLKSYDAKAPENKDSALIWAFGGPIKQPPKKGRQALFGPTMSTAAVHDGLVYISELNGYLHCLDAETGKRHWVHDVRSGIVGSPYWADGKIYLCAEDDVWVLAHGKTAKLLAHVEMDARMWTTPAAANGVVFLLTDSKLYAIGKR